MSKTARIDPPFIGWATFAYPHKSSDDYRAMLEKQRRAGANYVWVGHNNPGYVDAHKAEPALSYAVYAEATQPLAPRYEEAKQILDAQLRFLAVCREMDIPVVLPLGYQIQMGRAWETRYPEELRRDAQGRVINWGGISASCYSLQYREDIARYYRWAYENVVEPYRDLIVMVNLSDEPFGGDYSPPAEAEFRRRHGFGFNEVGDDPQRQRLLGQFQSDMIVDYAAWSADAWHEVCPAIPSTMSFCGFHGREENLMPTVPNLFRKTPPHFEITFDLYPRDGPFDHAITPPDIHALWVFLTQLGGLSRRYHKPVWMWPTGNSWGTGQESTDPGHVSDAVANVYYNVDRIVAAGGHVKGLAIWNYNCNNQGLFDDPHQTAYDPERMFGRLSKSLTEVKPVMKRSLEKSEERACRLAIYAPPEAGFLRLGRTQAPISRLEEQETCPWDFTALEVLTHWDIAYEVVETLDAVPESCQALIVLPQTAEELPASAGEELKKRLQAGLILLVSPTLADLFGVSVSGDEPTKHSLAGGTLWVADPRKAYRIENSAAIEEVWKGLLGVNGLSPLFHYRTPWRAMWYNLTGDNQEISVDLSQGERGACRDRCDSASTKIQGPSKLQGLLPHRGFVLIDKE